MVDAARALLLYGPYVIFALLDGSWYRVKYDDTAIAEDNKYKEENQSALQS